MTVPALLISIDLSYTVVRKGDRVRIGGRWYPIRDIVDIQGGAYKDPRNGTYVTALTVRSEGGLRVVPCPGLNESSVNPDLADKYPPPFVTRVRRLVELPVSGPRVDSPGLETGAEFSARPGADHEGEERYDRIPPAQRPPQPKPYKSLRL